MNCARVARHLLFIAFLGWNTALAATASVGSDPIRSFGNFLSGLFQTQGQQLRELTSSGKYEEAAQMWAREKQFFEPRMEEYRDVLSTVAGKLNQQFESTLKPAVDQLRTVESERSNWRGMPKSRAAVQEVLKQYSSIELLQSETFRSPAIVDGERLLNRVEATLVEHAVEAFEKYDHFSGQSFLADYPAGLPHNFFRTHFQRLQPNLEAAKPDQIRAFVVAYAGSLTADHRRYLGTLYMRDANVAPSIPTRLGRTVEMKRLGLTASDAADLRLLTVNAKSSSNETFSVAVSGSDGIPRENIELAEFNATALGNTPLTLVVHTKDVAVDRQITGRESVTSRAVTGHSTLPNPEYEKARLRYMQAQQNAAQTELRNSLSPPNSPLVAVLQGVASVAATAAREKAFQEFSALSPTITQPVYSDYRFETATVKVLKKATIVASAVDQRSQLVSEIELPFQEERQFTIGYGIRDTDTERYTLANKYNQEKEVEQFELSNASVSLIDIVKQFESASPQPVRSRSIDHMMAALQPATRTQSQSARESVPIAVDDARFHSVVVITGVNGALGAGFFVAENLVLTNDHVVQGAFFAELKTRDGKELYGKVVKAGCRRRSSVDSGNSSCTSFGTMGWRFEAWPRRGSDRPSAKAPLQPYERSHQRGAQASSSWLA
jgi:serine protease Do